MCASPAAGPGASAFGILKYANDWAAFYDYWFAAAGAQGVPVHVLRYENATADPNRTFADLFAFMGVAYDARRLAKAARDQKAKRPAAATFGDRLSKVCGAGTDVEGAVLAAVAPVARRLGYATVD